MKHNLSKISLAAMALLFVALFGLSSCKKDKDDPDPTPTQQIVGDWEVKSFTIDGVEIKGTVVLSSMPASNRSELICIGCSRSFSSATAGMPATSSNNEDNRARAIIAGSPGSGRSTG